MIGYCGHGTELWFYILREISRVTDQLSALKTDWFLARFVHFLYTSVGVDAYTVCCADLIGNIFRNKN